MGAEQIDMFGLWAAPQAVIARPIYAPPPRRSVMTMAYGTDTELQLPLDAPDPVEVEIMGVPVLVVREFGVSIYTLQPPGSLFFSSTGYRNMATGDASLDQVASLVEGHFNAPRDKYGLGKRLERWWPSYVARWQQAEAFHGRADRSRPYWGICAVEIGQDACWAAHDARQAEALARMRADGIDPNLVGPPRGFKGEWPVFK